MSNNLLTKKGKTKRCKRCDKRWCGTKLRMQKLYPDEPWMWTISFGKRKCRDKGSKR
jgi:hypothetical protein